MENKLIPYQATQCINANSVVVFAPHPDDEVFGCGGAIMRHVAAGVPLHVVILSDGAFDAIDQERQAIIEIREAESRKAADVLGYGEPEFWRLPDRGLIYGEALVRRIIDEIRNTAANLVYAPSLLEMHPDHRAVAMCVIEAVRRAPSKPLLALYEVGMPLSPNLLLDISDLAERKMVAMECFVSQNEKQRYDLDIAALNRYRTYTLPAAVASAEAYILVSAEELANDPLKLYQSEHKRQRELGLALDTKDVPLVSVIIRSMDRSTLSEALDSVALQTYPNIEVVVVNAKGEEHSKLDEWCGHFPLRTADTGEMLRRSRAGNVGLNNARGDYLIFLDDDDWFMPEHVFMLIDVLTHNPDIKVAYSCVTCVNEQKEPINNNFCQPFDRTLLLAGNYIPIHAALFSRSIVDEGCRMDESLDLYEDWDFWLQAAAYNDFIFVPHFSAYYRIGGQSGQGVRPDALFAQQISADLFEKWRIEWRREDLLDIMARVREHEATLYTIAAERDTAVAERDTAVAERDTAVAERDTAVAERDTAVAELDTAVAERDTSVAERDIAVAERNGHVAALYNSTSWRITQPLRFISHQLKRIRRAGELVMPAIKHGGGLKNTLNKAIQLYRREGLTGIKRGFRIVATSGQIIPALGSSEFDRNNYVEWIHRYDTLNDEMRATMRTCIGVFAHQPLISVVMPTYNSKSKWLIEAIESVRKQIYPHWELCIADDASTDNATRSILERYATEDARIKVVFREQNGHISAASNSALELATGEWVALLDHDDLLTEHALFWMADAINANPDVRLIYSDEDKTNEIGKRFDPYFKCDWNADLFYSHNLITHLGVYHTELLREIGGFRLSMEGAQDYDLALRCIERISTKQIHHIPRVLYHWRMHAESTAQSADAKPYAMLAGEKALNEHFQRQGLNATAELIGCGFRVRYALPDILPLVSLIIPTRNGLHLLQQCVESILNKTTYPNYEILIIDNGSDDPATLQYFKDLQSESRVRIVRDDRPFNYSALNNAAVKKARGKLIGLINNDIEVISPDWLSEMVSHALRPDVGAVGASLWYPNNTLQHGGVILGIGWWAGHAHKGFPKGSFGYVARMVLISEFTAVTGACLIVRKELYEKVGGLNEFDLQIACNDVDFCLRLREAGYRNIWTPYAELYHHESATRGFEDTLEKQARFAKEVAYMRMRWGDQLSIDPAYSPNLTLAHEDFSLAWPPRVELITPPNNRVDKALIMVDRKGLGLEIGPSHNPLTPKKHGYNVHILDHASADELRTKYNGHGVNLDNIEEVDFVWHGEPLHELIGREHCYDWIIASHVIEHTPDLISFLTECEKLIKPDGVLSLIIPDKRYCFDYFNALTSTGELLDAFEQKRKRPSPGKVFDHFAGAAKRNDQIAWSADEQGVVELVHDFSEAHEHWQRARITEEYIDVHNWRFTPANFRVLLSDLQALGLTGLEIKAEFDTSGCEFYVTLGKSISAQPMNRLLTVERVLDESKQIS